MKEKYEIKYYNNEKRHCEIVYTNSLIKFIKLRLTKVLIYYKVNFEDKYKDYFL